jgi:hypothetical protein
VHRLDELSDAELEELESWANDFLRELQEEVDRRQDRRDVYYFHAGLAARKGGRAGLRAGGWGLLGAVLGTAVAPWVAIPFAVLTAAEAAYAFHQTRKGSVMDPTALLALPGDVEKPEDDFTWMRDEELRRSCRNFDELLRFRIPREWRRRAPTGR